MLLAPRKKKDENVLVDLLKKHCEYEENLFNLFGEKEIDIEELIKRVNNLKKIRDESLKHFNIEINENKIPDKIILVQDRDLPVSLVESYNLAKDEIISVYNEKNVPVLNLNRIKNFILEFSKLVKDNILFTDKNIDSTIVISSKDEKIKTVLQNGKRIIITDKNCNFENYTYEELLEILRFFDICVSDSSYDHVRTEIVKQINLIK